MEHMSNKKQLWNPSPKQDIKLTPISLLEEKTNLTCLLCHLLSTSMTSKTELNKTKTNSMLTK